MDLFGRVCDIEAISEIAHRYGAAVVEDACQAFGAAKGGRKAGTTADLGCYSFFPSSLEPAPRPLEVRRSIYGERVIVALDHEDPSAVLDGQHLAQKRLEVREAHRIRPFREGSLRLGMGLEIQGVDHARRAAQAGPDDVAG